MSLLDLPLPVLPSLPVREVLGLSGMRASPLPPVRRHPRRLHANTIHAIERVLMVGKYSTLKAVADQFGATRGQVEYIGRRLVAQGLR